MSIDSSYKILGLKPGASEAEIKKTYRKLALQFHPDRNTSEHAAKKFLEIKQAYEELSKRRPIPYQRDKSYENAAEIIREEKKKAYMRAKDYAAEKRRTQEKFNQSELHDLILLLRYILNGFLLVFSIAAILGPILLAIFVEPFILIATIYFIIIGGFLLWHIHGKRKTWFKLGRFNISKNKLKAFLSKPAPKFSNDYCCYMSDKKADGKSYHIKLVKVTDIKYVSFGAMDHKASFKQNTTNLVIPRSAKAEWVHKLSSIIKLVVIVSFIILFPVTSIFWRAVAGIIIAMILSSIFHKIHKVKAKTTFLLTPALIIKSVVWIFSIFAISNIGPGFDLTLNSYKYIVFAGLLFLVDMLFDLLFGLFPFYTKLFRPIFQQGKILNKLYKEGFQNYVEYPIYSIINPMFKWIF